MEKEAVVPDVIDQVPAHTIQITFPSGAVPSNGNELTPTQVKDQPTSLEWPTEEGALYTLVMTDPDAPSRASPTYSEVMHWLVVNIPGTNISEGKTLTEYRGSGPPKDTGLHRYVFLVFKQPGPLETDEKVINRLTRDGRLKWSARTFAKKYNLGNAVAGNFYQAQWDEYVALLQQQTVAAN